MQIFYYSLPTVRYLLSAIPGSWTNALKRDSVGVGRSDTVLPISSDPLLVPNVYGLLGTVRYCLQISTFGFSLFHRDAPGQISDPIVCSVLTTAPLGPRSWSKSWRARSKSTSSPTWTRPRRTSGRRTRGWRTGSPSLSSAPTQAENLLASQLTIIITLLIIFRQGSLT